MKNKIIGIFVCTLLIAATIMPVAGIINNDEYIIKNHISVESELQFSATSEDDDWPMFHHDLQNTGYSTSIAPQKNNLLWSYRTEFMIDSSPIVAYDRVFIGSEDHTFYCFDANNGNIIWTFPIDGATSSATSAVYKGKVYVPRNYGYLHCLNSSTGSEIWTFSPGYGTSYSMGSVAVANDKVYCSSKKTLYCLDAENGYEYWNYTRGFHRIACPAIYDNKVYIGSYNGKVYCFDANNGSKLWDSYIGGEIIRAPTISDGKLYIGSDWRFYCLDAGNGSILWNSDWIAVKSSSAVADGNVYFTGTNNTDGTYCLNAETGEQIWKSPYGGSYSSPAIADGKLYIGGTEFLYCLEVDTGKKLWTYSVSPTGHLVSSPAIAYGRVYMAGTTTGRVYCFEDPSKPPKIPTVSGPISGILDQNVEFTIMTIDPEGYDVEYYIDWGDGSSSGWIGLYDSGEEITVTHIWYELGTYDIKVKARDRDRLESRWTEPHTITVVVAPILNIRSIAGGFFKVSSIIENIGSADANDVNWSITVDGGIILTERITSGFISSMPMGEVTTVNTGFIFGFGSIVVTVSASVSNGLSDVKEQTGSVFLIFIKIKFSGDL